MSPNFSSVPQSSHSSPAWTEMMSSASTMGHCACCSLQNRRKSQTSVWPHRVPGRPWKHQYRRQAICVHCDAQASGTHRSLQTGKWERVQLTVRGPAIKWMGMLLSKEHFQGPSLQWASADTKIMEGVEHRSKLPGEGKQESPCVGGTEAYWREDMVSEPSSPGDSPRSAWMINPWSA